MDPSVKNVEEENGILRFQLENTNVSIANALRRIILSEVPTIVFKTEPYAESKMNITKNNTRLNNEILKQRFSCIPIHITDTTFPVEDHEVELDIANNSGSIQLVTTKDLKIKNIKNDRYLTEDAVKKIFPPDPITKDYIVITRLRPKTSGVDVETIKLSCKLSIGTAKVNSAYNIASTCTYKATQDRVAANAAWLELDKKKTIEDKAEWAEQREQAKSDWLLLDAKRYTVKNSYDFIIESVGVFTNSDIVYRASDVMVSKLKLFINNIQSQYDLIKTSETTIENCFDITLKNEDYTLGKVLEYMIFEKHYNLDTNPNSDKTVTYCGFNKPHPHIDESIIRIGFKDAKEPANIVEVLVSAATDTISLFEKIKNNFNERD